MAFLDFTWPSNTRTPCNFLTAANGGAKHDITNCLFDFSESSFI